MSTTTWSQDPAIVNVNHGAKEDASISVSFTDDITGWTFEATRDSEPLDVSVAGNVVTIAVSAATASSWLAGRPSAPWVLRRTAPTNRDLLVGRWVVGRRG